VESIRTPRLTLRPWKERDVDALHQLWQDPDVRLYLWDDIAISRERAVEAVRSHFESVAKLGIGYWALRLRDVERLIGFCGFRSVDETQEIELMYGLLPEFWGRGLATEASQAALEFLWKKTRYARVYARADRPNTKSIEVMRRLGMRQHSTTETAITYVLERPG
jgi:[ribosomal protein S5]-alanine N-acetyltransferase